MSTRLIERPVWIWMWKSRQTYCHLILSCFEWKSERKKMSFLVRTKIHLAKSTWLHGECLCFFYRNLQLLPACVSEYCNITSGYCDIWKKEKFLRICRIWWKEMQNIWKIVKKIPNHFCRKSCMDLLLNKKLSELFEWKWTSLPKEFYKTEH